MYYLGELRALFLFIALGLYSIFGWTAPNIEVKATADNLAIKFEVVNSSKQTLSLSRYTLPWSLSLGGVRLFAFCGLENPRPLRQLLTADYDSRFVSLQPSARLSGELKLSLRLPDIESCRQSEPVTIFWFYRPVLEDEDSTDEFNGMLYFEKLN